MKTLSNIKISGKLYALILLAIMGMVSIAATSQHQMGRVFDLANYATINTVPSFNALNTVRVSFQKLRIATLFHVLGGDDARLVVLEREIQEQREAISKMLALYQDKLISEPEDQRHLDEVSAAIKTFYEGQDLTLLLSRQKMEAQAQANSEKIAPLATKVDQALQSHLDFDTKLAAQGSADALGALGMSLWITVSVTGLMTLLLGLFGWVIANRELSRPIGSVVDNLKLLAAGGLDVTISGVSRRDEVGDIARAAQVFKEFVQKLDTQSWIKTQSAEINAALQQAEDFKALAQMAISRIAPAIGAGHGAIYVADSERRLTLLGSYGYRERKHLNNSFHVGEGLVGQAAMEKKPITLTAPQDYIQINSGLGEGPPACIAVLPIMHQERVLAVLEVASFRQFSERELALLDELVPALATSMEIMDRSQRTRELLAATQEQAERMEKQAAQMEEQTVEMEAQQAELQETENWFRSIIETAPDGMLVIDAAGRILLANPQAGRLLGYAPGELLGTDLAQRMPALAFTGDSTVVSDALAAICKDGSSVTLDASCSPLPDRGGRGRCVSVALRIHVQAGGQSA